MVTHRALEQQWPVRHRGFIAGVLIVAVVLLATGWPASITFWMVAMILMVASGYMAMILTFPAFLVLLPLQAIFARVGRPWSTTAAHLTVPVGQLLIGTVSYLTVLDLNTVADVRLPFENGNVSVIAILAVAVFAWIVAAGRFEDAQSWFKGAVTPPPPPPPHVPDLDSTEPEDSFWSTDPVVAWRSWSWNGSALRGFFVEWPGPTLSAACHQCAKPPNWSHTCGIYGVTDPADMPQRGYGPTQVVGCVELWGDVIEHERGYRASHARIVALWVHWLLIDEVRQRYPGVEVHPGPFERSSHG